MLIIPAVDIKDGKCVRLTQGKADTAVVYQDDPSAAALYWQEKGARYLHLVDLDGAFGGRPANFAVIKKILTEIKIPAEVGGGIRSFEDIDAYLKAGADRVIIGTRAVTDPSFLEQAVKKFGGKIALSIDDINNKPAISGWIETEKISVIELAKFAKTIGIKTIVYTDISVDGTLHGPNFGKIEEFFDAVKINTIISGGISSIDHINGLKKYENKNVIGIIIGKALYTGKLKPEELWTG